MAAPAGFLNLLKPPGMTSHDVVYQVRRLLPRKTKVGHLGTLDPAATGVLPVAVGQATRLISILPDLGEQMKAYLAEVQMGVRTSSDDLDTEVLERRPIAALACWGALEWERELAAFRGDISQIPPQVSAIRTGGQRAYDRVRKGETVALAARQVRVARCDFLSWDGAAGKLRFFLVCSSGTYVRSVARDLGETLQVGGALSFLVRTSSGPFRLEQGLTLEELRRDGLERHLLPESFPFAQLPARAERVVEKGRRLQGDYLPGVRYRALNGLIMGAAEAGTATVEAVFAEVPG
jgi:tRNA pseudouridine55 synthase